MDLGGLWRAAEADDRLRRDFPDPLFDDGGWPTLAVPGQWQSATAFARSAGPLLYRRHFELAPVVAPARAWLVLDGVFYQSDVWLDGSYLGDTEGYFFPHAFDVTAALGPRHRHVLGVEVACNPPEGPAKVALTGVFGCADGIDRDFNPGGIWAPVRLDLTGPVRVAAFKATCREATDNRAVLQLEAVLDSAGAVTARLGTRLVSPAGEVAAAVGTDRPLAAGHNRVRWTLEVTSPLLWWPAGLGRQDLYDLTLEVDVDGERSDERALRTGLRTVRMRDFVWRVNGERLFLRGANLAPTRRDLAAATPAEVEADVRSAQEAGLNLLRVRGHIGRPELYEAADRAGVMLWQDMPLQWAYRGIRAQAVRQAGAAVDFLGHHPSIVLWCGHNEPFAPRSRPGAGGLRNALGWYVGQILPNRDRTLLDRSIRRALHRADSSRPVLTHSGVLPHPAWGTDSHLHYGWYHGRATGLARLARAWPATVRFVGELGAQAVPSSASFMAPERWPALDWDRLRDHYGMHTDVFARRLPPEQFSSFASWQAATQAHQAEVVRSQVEALRRLKYRPAGGFAVSSLNDAQEAVSWALLDHRRAPKLAWDVLGRACADVIVVAGWPGPRLRPGPFLAPVHVVNDRRQALDGAVVVATLTWPGGGRRWAWEGRAPADSVSWVGRVDARLPFPPFSPATAAAGPWAVELRLELTWPGGTATNAYSALMPLPQAGAGAVSPFYTGGPTG